jgi:hypothetical protein
MAELLASTEDIQTWLDPVNLRVTDGSTDQFQVEAHNIVKSQLASTYAPTLLYGWASPATTPKLIRGIAGRLVAAYVIRKVYARERAGEGPAYANFIYNEAIKMLTDLRTGAAVLLADDGTVISEQDNTLTSFYPNDTAPGPYFTMDSPL